MSVIYVENEIELRPVCVVDHLVSVSSLRFLNSDIMNEIVRSRGCSGMGDLGILERKTRVVGMLGWGRLALRGRGTDCAGATSTETLSGNVSGCEGRGPRTWGTTTGAGIDCCGSSKAAEVAS